jgi:hypothetical protein
MYLPWGHPLPCSTMYWGQVQKRHWTQFPDARETTVWSVTLVRDRTYWFQGLSHVILTYVLFDTRYSLFCFWHLIPEYLCPYWGGLLISGLTSSIGTQVLRYQMSETEQGITCVKEDIGKYDMWHGVVCKDVMSVVFSPVGETQTVVYLCVWELFIIKSNQCVCLLWIDETKTNIKPIYECRCNERL